VTNREDRILDLISDFENATDTLRVRVNARGTLTGELDTVFDRARLINNFMNRNRLNTRAETQWNAIRTDLNTLASYYRITWSWDVAGTPPIAGGPVYNVNDRDFRTLVTRLERNTDAFQRQIGTALARQNRASRNEINRYIDEFEDATNRLNTRFNSRQVADTDVR
jgi:hypothetical protein